MTKEIIMKTIALYTPVYGVDHPCGRSTSILIDRQTQRVKHLVVKEVSAPNIERLVPIEAVAKTSSDRIQLNCSQDEFKRMDPFVVIQNHAEMVPDYENAGDMGLLWPYVPEKQIWIETGWHQIPPGEIALYQGARVQATNGPVGIVTGLKVEPASMRVKQLVIEPSLPWDHRQIAVPIQQIEQAEENVVYLKLDKRGLDALAGCQTNQNMRRSRHVAA